MKRLVTVASIAMMLACSTAVAQGDQKPKDAERARLNEKRITEVIRRARTAAARERGGPILIEGNNIRIVFGTRFSAVLGRKDSVGQALADVRRAVDKAQRAQDPKEIQKQLDHAEKALMKARKELWKRVREQDKAKLKRRPTPTSKPTTKSTSGVATQKSATRSNREHR